MDNEVLDNRNEEVREKRPSWEEEARLNGLKRR